MCCLCTWFAWSFDFLQRVLTFILTCCLCVAVCFGLSLAIITGVAYGYNYSMAEWLSFTRSDTTVYMRRGQFYDRPHLRPGFRRSAEDYDIFSSNITTDYEDNKQAAAEGAKPLADTWIKTQEARKYAERLTKYTPQKMNSYPVMFPTPTKTQFNPGLFLSTTIRSRLISIKPNPIIVETTLWESGSSQIVMRNFEAIEDFSAPSVADPMYDIPMETVNNKEKLKADSKLQQEEINDGFVTMSVRATKKTYQHSAVQDYTPEEGEDDIVYKPV